LSSPFIWILFPFFFSLILIFIPGLTKIKAVIIFIVTALLAILGWLLPIGAKFLAGPWPLKISDTFTLLGRTLTLSSVDKPILTFFYFLTCIWVFGGLILKLPSFFAPFGLIVVSLLVAALAVEPFLYGALLIEMAVIVSTILLTSLSKNPDPGILRFLIFQTLGIPFILFAGWMLNQIENGVIDQSLVVGSVILLGIGFTFLLAIFPFNTWLPQLTGQAEPYVTGFILVMLPLAVLLFALNLIDTYSWLRNQADLLPILQIAGTLMIATGGIWAAFQNHLGRLLGYAVIVESGFALLAIGLREQGGLQLFTAQLLPRAFGILVWIFAMSSLRTRIGGLDFPSIKGLVKSYPFLSGSLVVAQLSLGGLPLLASFPIRITLFSDLYAQSPLLTLWVFIGSLGLLLAGLRSLGVFATEVEKIPWKIHEGPGEIVLSCLSVLIILMMGLFPQLFFPLIINLLPPYSFLL
jgi:NADH-quinone oxidoreductase subunit N